mgnify:CR=1 FL=1
MSVVKATYDRFPALIISEVKDKLLKGLCLAGEMCPPPPTFFREQSIVMRAKDKDKVNFDVALYPYILSADHIYFTLTLKVEIIIILPIILSIELPKPLCFLESSLRI